jgi:hypothetical protein
LVEERVSISRLVCSVVLLLVSGIALAQDKSRVFVLTDISNEPDDEQSLVRFLVYSNEYDVEGLVATTSTWLRTGTREDLIRKQIDAYSKVRDNLLVHARGYPSAQHLRAVTFTGQPSFGMQGVGEGNSSAGSRHLIAAADKADARPLWVSVWGGANTLAQALIDVRSSRTPVEVQAFVARLRVYTISDQDDAGPWIRREFPELFYIASPSQPDELEYWRATWSGISGDRWYKNAPMHHFELVDNPWLEANIMRDHGPLGALYPKVAYIMEGDTPSFLGLIRNGLGWHENPGYGGWAGRYVMYRPAGEPRPFWTNNQKSRDTVTAANGHTDTSDPASVWRWREHYQNDFAARMDWCVAKTPERANHNPQALLNGDSSKQVLKLSARGGIGIALSAKGSVDPDGDEVDLRWWIYDEAGTLSGATLSSTDGLETRVKLPRVEQSQTLHVILEVRDNGSPTLFAYRRAVIEVNP